MKHVNRQTAKFTAVIASLFFLTSAQPAEAQAYVGHIAGEFKGWTGDTIYKLDDGHIIQQASYHYHYHYAYHPEIIIYKSKDGALKVHVTDDDDEDIAVILLK